jgi:hypothetical protein
MFEDDPFGQIKQDKVSINPSARQVNQFHEKADTDAGPNSAHHTLGTNRNQSSPGDHVHDGKASKPVGAGLGLVVTGSRGGNAALASLLQQLAKVIDFTDTTTA